MTLSKAGEYAAQHEQMLDSDERHWIYDEELLRAQANGDNPIIFVEPDGERYYQDGTIEDDDDGSETPDYHMHMTMLPDEDDGDEDLGLDDKLIIIGD